MRRSEEKNTSAVPRLGKERLYTGYSLREHPVFSALVSSFTHIVLFTSWFHRRIHNRQNLKYYRLSKTSWKIHENITLWFNNKSQGFLLVPFESFKTRRLPILASTRLPLYFPTRLCEIHSKTRTLLLRICKVNCDWSLTADVREIFSRLGFADGFSQRVQTSNWSLKPGCSHRLLTDEPICLFFQ